MKIHKTMLEMQLFKRQRRVEELRAFIATANYVMQNSSPAQRERYINLPIASLQKMEEDKSLAIESIKQNINRFRL